MPFIRPLQRSFFEGQAASMQRFMGAGGVSGANDDSGDSETCGRDKSKNVSKNKAIRAITGLFKSIMSPIRFVLDQPVELFLLAGSDLGDGDYMDSDLSGYVSEQSH